MPITVRCRCGSCFTTDDANGGREFECTRCQYTFEFPGRGKRDDFGAVPCGRSGRRQRSQPSPFDGLTRNHIAIGAAIAGVAVVCLIGIIAGGGSRQEAPWPVHDRLTPQQLERADETARREMAEHDAAIAAGPWNIDGDDWSLYTIPGGEATFLTASAVTESHDVADHAPGSTAYFGELRSMRFGVIVEPLAAELIGAPQNEVFRSIRDFYAERGIFRSMIDDTTVSGWPALEFSHSERADAAAPTQYTDVTIVCAPDRLYTFKFSFLGTEGFRVQDSFQRAMQLHVETPTVEAGATPAEPAADAAALP